MKNGCIENMIKDLLHIAHLYFDYRVRVVDVESEELWNAFVDFHLTLLGCVLTQL